MALADFAALRTMTATPYQVTIYRKPATGSTVNENAIAEWALAGPPTGVAPTAAVVPDNTTVGAIGRSNGGSGRQIIVGGSLHALVDVLSVAAPDQHVLLVVDRLSHQAGLVGNITTLQTTNLPTAALTRYTSAVGVMMALEVYSTVGSGTGTLTTTYTNSAGTGSRTSTLPFVSTSVPRASSMLFLPLQSGDLGVKSVESIQLSGAKSSAGNIGITLFKPLAMISPTSMGKFGIEDIVGWNEEIVDDACVQILRLSPDNANNNGSEVFVVTLDLAEA